MSLSVENLRRALQNNRLEAEYRPVVRRSAPWCPPPPLSWWVTLDPALKLGIISTTVAPVIAGLALWFAP